MTRAAVGKARPRAAMPSRHRETLKAVAQKHSVSPEAMLEGDRRYAVSYARHEFFYLVLSGDAPPSVSLAASWMGMDHTSALSGVRRHRELLER